MLLRATGDGDDIGADGRIAARVLAGTRTAACAATLKAR
jgi:hypothetical protein